jgi:hypothetical protein
MKPLVDQQRDLNRTTQDRWAEYASHRAKVTGLLTQLSPSRPGRLCVLGVGNANDLDLSELLKRFAEIHLVDLDPESLAAGVSRQGFAGDPRIALHAMDVTGWFERRSQASPVTAHDIAVAADAAEAVAESLGRASFDVVASVGLLSQLMQEVVSIVGERHPHFVEALQAIRTGHVRLLLALLAPSGSALLATDVVSSDTCPALRTLDESQLPSLILHEVRRHNFFHGVNPYILEKQLRSDPAVAGRIEQIESLSPWKWDVGPRIYAVCGFKFRAKA